MSEGDPEYFDVRHRLWALCFRWVVIVQAVVTVLVGAFLVLRAVTTATVGHPGDLACSGMVYIPATGYAVFLAVRHWSFVRLWLTAVGLGQSGTFIRWQRVTKVRRRYSLLSGWVLVVQSESGGVITLPQRPSDPDGFREAVERFAGPDHPLARAVAEVTDG
jgi:hypothetical protein